MGAKKQTIGYNYYFSLQMGLGRGPINEIAEIRIGDVTALDQPICIKDEGQLVLIDKPNLFGGEQKEGGIRGPMYVYNGAPDQELQPAITTAIGLLPSIETMLGGDVPSFRGVVTIWFDGLVASLNPYPKEWAFRVRRTTAGWWDDAPWYSAKATITLESESGKIIRAMNAAHMLYEINTNPEWGRGMPPELLDENSYVYAANQLCDEGLGLCIPWFRQESIKDFIPVIIDHIGGAQYVDRETGKMTLRLIRGDYDIANLPLFTPDSGLISIEEDDASSEETAYNEIIVKGFDPTTKEEISIRVQNGASIQSLGEIISNTIEYRGIPTRALLARIAMRELKLQTGLRKFTLTFDRRAWRITPGMPFRISFPSKGIADMVIRAGEVNEAGLTDGRITVKGVQDVFGMPATAYIDPQPPIWVPPNFTAAPSPETRLVEINYRDYYLRSTQAERDTVDEGTSYIAELAKDVPNVNTQGFDLATKVTGEEYEVYTTGGFTSWLTLAGDLGPLDTAAIFDLTNMNNFAVEFSPGEVSLIGDEQVSIVTLDTETGEAVLKRGVADTIPQAHDAGSTVWNVDDEMVSDGREYQDGEEVFAKALTRTSTDLLPIDDAVEDSIEVDQRVFRPYPPGDVKVDGDSIYTATGVYPEPEITWTHRDRIAQQDVPVGHTEASVGPEPGVEYRVRVYDIDGVTLLRTEDLGLVDNWTYDSTMQGADGAPAFVYIELESVRDDIASYFNYRFPVALNPFPRITEDGEHRETEDGELRFTED